MTSYLQTVEVHLPNTTRPVYTMEMRPVCPVPLEKGQPCRVTKEDGTVITWCHDGTITMDFKDTTTKVFYAKPTLQEALTQKGNGNGTFFKFNRDGSVELTAFNNNWFYGAPQDHPAEVGAEIETAHLCVGGNWDLYSLCYGYCDYTKEQIEQDEEDCRCCYRHDYDSGVDDDALGTEGYGGDW